MIKMLKEADRSAFRTFIGTALVKLATGIVGLWGTINIYFFSYLRNRGTQITSLTNSIIMLCAMVPASFAVLISTRLTVKYGYKKIIRICAIIFAFSPFLINLGLNQVTLGLFYLFIPITCFGISSIPILNCLWSQFPNHLNKVSGLAVLFFSLGMIIWNLIFLSITNPKNQLAEIDQNKNAFFKKQISDNIFKASNVMFVCSGLCFLVGSTLIEKKQDQSHKTIQLQQESPPRDIYEIKLTTTQLQLSPHKKEDSTKQNPKKLLRATLKDKKFIILFFISYLVPLYIIFMSLYMKLIFMPIINDDHFLAFCSVVLTISAIFGAPFWGYVGDTKGFKFTLLLIIIIDIAVKILGLFCQRKWNLMALYFILGFNDKGVLTIIGPGLIQIFGLQLATELIPYKGIALFFAYVTVPLIQIIFSKHFSYQTILCLFIGCTVAAGFLAYHFYTKVDYKPFKHAVDHLQQKSREFEQKSIEIQLP